MAETEIEFITSDRVCLCHAVARLEKKTGVLQILNFAM
jgi:hypothetical protein